MLGAAQVHGSQPEWDFDWLRPDYNAVLVNDENPPDTLFVYHRATQVNTRSAAGKGLTAVSCVL